MKEEDVKKLIQAFGVIKFFNMAKDKDEEGKTILKGYCFFEY